MNTKKRLVNTVFGLVLIGLLGLFLLPLFWMYLLPMRSNMDIITNPLGLPEKISFANHVRAWREAEMGQHIGISFFITVFSTLLLLSAGSLAAFSFSRLAYRGKKILYSLFFLGLILPIQSYLVGLFVLMKAAGLLNTLWAVILPLAAIGLPLQILLMKNYYDTLPGSLEESALLDGAGSFLIYRRIILPLSTPVTATVITLTAIAAWNEFLLPYVFIQNTALRPLTTMLYVFSTRHAVNLSLLAAALVMIASPMLVIYAVFQRPIQKGITAGAIKS